MIIIEFIQTIMAFTQMLALFTVGMDGFDKVKDRYMWIFENVF
jgi:hypothetical protein